MKYSFIFIVGAALAVAQVGPQSVFRASPEFLKQVHQACDQIAYPEFAGCFVNQMKRAGASAAALAFTNLIEKEGYARSFRTIGPVDVVYSLNPFRANELNDCLLVNGKPQVINVDDPKLHDEEAVQRVSKNSNATLWPDDRVSGQDPLAVRFSDGSLQFVVSYRVQNGCHACELIGYAFFAFEFARDGKFLGVKLIEFVRKKDAIPVSVRMGQKFSVLLASNPSTGYSWQVNQAPPVAILRSLPVEFEAAKSDGKVGVGGNQMLTFEPVSKGVTNLKLIYLRPWEKGKPPAQSISLRVMVK